MSDLAETSLSALRARLVAVGTPLAPEVEATLAARWALELADARASWPTVAFDSEALARFLAPCVAGLAAEEVAQLYLADLCLASALAERQRPSCQ